MLRSFLALAFFSLVALPASAQERAAVVAQGGSESVDPAVWAQLMQLFEQHLHDAGFEVDTGGAPRLPDTCHRECRDEDRRSRGVDVLGVLTLEAAADGVITHVLVSVADALGEYTHRETVGGRDAALVAELAVVESLADRERGRRPWVSVSGTPEAAYVSIDGRDVGLVPWEGEVEAGEREISVHLPGFVSDTRTVTAAPGAPIDIEVELAPAPRTTDETPRWALIGTGGPLLVAGLALTIMGGTYATRAGECVTPDCRASTGGSAYVFGDTEAALLGAGAAAIGVGAALLVAGILIDVD